MAKIFIGLNGHYEIYNSGTIIYRKTNGSGQLNGEYKIFRNVQSIPSRQDRWRINQLISGEILSDLRFREN